MDDKFVINDDEIRAENSTGNIKISNDVIAAIAGISAEEIAGVAYMYTTLPGAIAEKFANKKNQTKGVKVAINEDGIALDMYIVVDYGVRIREVSEAVQKSVKSNIETMTGMTVKTINVRIEGVSFETAPKSDDVTVIDAE